MKPVICAAALVVCGTAPLWGQAWDIEQVGEGTKPEIALSPEGAPQIAYMIEDFSGGVFLAVKEGGWQSETVSTGYFYGPLDYAIDAQGVSHIVYHDHTSEDATYAFKEGGSWHLEVVSHPGHDGWDSSIALGPAGEVHLSFIDPSQFGSADGVEWAVRLGGTWSIGGIGSGPIPYEFGTAIAVDGGGRPHLVYHDGSERLNVEGGSDLFYALLNDQGSWDIEAVDTEGDAGKFASLALDSERRPHIAYFSWEQRNSGALKYARWDGAEWEIETIDGLDDVEISFLGARRMMSLALDADDRPHIAYADREALKYACWQGDGWHVQVVTQASPGQVLGQLAALALDGDGRPHVAYFELPDPPSSSLGTIFYAVGQVPTAVGGEGQQELPDEFVPVDNFPNPFNAGTIIRYSLAAAGEVELAVYNLAGQRIRRLAGGRRRAGDHRTVWDGLDDGGRAAASGLYLLRLQAGSLSQARKMLLLR